MKLTRLSYLSIAMAGVVAVVAIAQAPDDAEVAGQADKPADLASYYIGLSIGEQMRAQGLTAEDLDAASMAMAIADELSGNDPRLSDEELAAAGQAVRALLQAKAQSQRQEMQNAAAANREKAEVFLAENAKKEEVKELPSGLQYKVVESGSGESPTLENVVKVHYTGRLMNGEIFDSSVQRGEPAQFQVGQLIRGWQEALPRMKVGGKWILYVPPDLAYGPQGSPPKIGPNELLIFEMELLEIVQ